MMVDMLKDFDDVCSTKMMLSSFTQMMKGGLLQILEFFAKSKFHPPLMRTPLIVQWPEGLPNLIFAKKTCLLTTEDLRQHLQERRWKDDFWEALRDMITGRTVEVRDLEN